MKIKSLVPSLALSLTLIACGGGGSDEVAGFTSVSFPSSSVAAAPTLENGEKVEDVAASNQTGGVPVLNAIDSNSELNVALLGSKTFQNTMQYMKKINVESYSLNNVVNETENCFESGTMSYNGSGEPNVSAQITVTATNCKDGRDTTNGIMYISVSNYDNSVDEFKDVNVRFMSDFSITSNSDGSFSKIFKNSYMNMHIIDFIDAAPWKYEILMSMQATDGTEFYGLKDSKYHFEDNHMLLTTQMYQTQGRIYIDNLTTYVDYDTSYDMSQTPFVFGENGLERGQARYNMSNSGKLKIVADNNVVTTYIDADGDGTYEISEND